MIGSQTCGWVSASLVLRPLVDGNRVLIILFWEFEAISRCALARPRIAAHSLSTITSQYLSNRMTSSLGGNRRAALRIAEAGRMMPQADRQ